MKQKIALFCNLAEKNVISVEDADHIYELPARLHAEEVDDRVCERLGIWAARANLEPWNDLVARLHNPHHRVRIGIVGKYTDFGDTYKSLNEALCHGGIANDSAVDLVFVDSELLDRQHPESELSEVDAILVPGGFGVRGTEGKIAAIRHARENNKPFFGICLGLQMAVCEYARNVLGLEGAMSREFDDDPKHPVIDLMPDQVDVTEKGGTMRLGAYPCDLLDGTMARKIYGEGRISERHRHRFEVNPEYHTYYERGLRIVGWSPDRRLAEIVELEGHPWFLACQFHPEFKSRPLAPHPLFSSFIKAAVAFNEAKRTEAA